MKQKVGASNYLETKRVRWTLIGHLESIMEQRGKKRRAANANNNTIVRGSRSFSGKERAASGWLRPSSSALPVCARKRRRERVFGSRSEMESRKKSFAFVCVEAQRITQRVRNVYQEHLRQRSNERGGRRSRDGEANKRANERECLDRRNGGWRNYAVRGDISESVLRQTSPEPSTSSFSRRGGKRKSLLVCMNPNPSSFCRNANKSVCGTKKKIALRREPGGRTRLTFPQCRHIFHDS